MIEGYLTMTKLVPPSRFMPSPKRLRVVRNGQTIVDTINALLVWEHEYYPRYYIPADEVAEPCHDTSGIGDIAGYVALDWNSMDGWYEEDEACLKHARNPYNRVDALRSSRHVRVEIDGEVVAESTSPVVLFETGFPPRYYLPALDVRQDLLVATDLVTACPYKGIAQYWSVGDHENIVWSYPSPLPESQPVQGLYCFYNEKVDLFVDGEPAGRPVTMFS